MAPPIYYFYLPMYQHAESEKIVRIVAYRVISTRQSHWAFVQVYKLRTINDGQGGEYDTVLKFQLAYHVCFLRVRNQLMDTYKPQMLISESPMSGVKGLNQFIVALF